jgi:DNA topoisomerase-2
MAYRQITYAPGLFKIFDEILVNAADNKVRDPSMDTVRVDIDQVGGGWGGFLPGLGWLGVC